MMNDFEEVGSMRSYGGRSIPIEYNDQFVELESCLEELLGNNKNVILEKLAALIASMWLPADASPDVVILGILSVLEVLKGGSIK